MPNGPVLLLGALGRLVQSATAVRELWLGASGKRATMADGAERGQGGWQRLEGLEANCWI